MEDTGPVAATPESAPAAIDATRALESLSQSQMDTWRKDGTLPDSIEVVKPDAEPKPAGDDAPALDAQNKPVLGADNKPISKREAKRQAEQQKINDTIRGKAEAERRAETAERELAELKARAGQPAAEPKPSAQPVEDKEPTIEDFPIDQFLDRADPYAAQLAAYNRAVSKYDRQQEQKATAAETEQRTAQSRTFEGAERVLSTYQERENTFVASAPDYLEKTAGVRGQLRPFVENGRGGFVPNPIVLELLSSPVSPALILHFAEHQDDFERIGRLGSTNLPAALRELGRLEAKYDTAGAAASAAPPANPITSAPAPPTVLGTRSADAADPVESAVKRRDTAAYIREANARDLATARR